MLTQVELKRIFHYDPETGLFTRLVATCNSVKIGDIANCQNKAGYIVIGFYPKVYKAHRLAFLYMDGTWPKYNVDHLNGVKNDNRWCNLRDVPQSINNQNFRLLYCNNTSGYTGVYWRADIKR